MPSHVVSLISCDKDEKPRPYVPIHPVVDLRLLLPWNNIEWCRRSISSTRLLQRKSEGRKPNEDYETDEGATPGNVSDNATGKGASRRIQGISTCFQGDESSKLGRKFRVNRPTTKKNKASYEGEVEW